MMRKMNVRRDSMGAASGPKGEVGGAGRFEKRALSHGARVSGLTMTGLAARARDQENWGDAGDGQAQGHVGQSEQKGGDMGEQEGSGKGMARRQSMPEGMSLDFSVMT